MKILPTVPCETCTMNPDAWADTPIGKVLYCGHERCVTIFDIDAACSVTYSPISVKAAGQLVAHAIRDRAQQVPITHAPH